MKKILLILLFFPFLVSSQHTIKDPDSGVISKYAADGQILKRYKLDSDGYKHGRYEEWYSTGERYSVENWRHGRPYGKQEYWFKNGQLDMRVYKDDAAGYLNTYGIFIRYYENGNKRFYVVRDRKGKKIGEDKEWFENGQLKEDFNYDKYGEKDGSQREWNEEGDLLSEENYTQGKKDGVFRKFFEYDSAVYRNEKTIYTRIYKIENWKKDQKHGDFIGYNKSTGYKEYQHQYKYGKKEGVWIEYFDSKFDMDFINDNDIGLLEVLIPGMETYQTWKDDKKHGVYRKFGFHYQDDKDYEDEDTTIEVNLILEEHYINNKKHGLSREWSLGSRDTGEVYGDNPPELERIGQYEGDMGFVLFGWQTDGDLISEVNYKDGEKDGVCKYYYQGKLSEELIYDNGYKKEIKKFREGDLFYEAVFNQDGNEMVVKKVDWNNWISRNYGGKFLNYTIFQDQEYIESLSTGISIGEKIIQKYKENVNYHTNEREIKEREARRYKSQTDSLNSVLSQYRKKKGEKRIAKILEKQENQEKIKKGSLSIIQRIDFLKRIIDSTNSILNNSQQAILNHSTLVDHYSNNINPVEIDIQKKRQDLQNEKLKSVYDLDHEYSEEYYLSERIYRLGDDVPCLPVSFLIHNRSIGPFRLGMVDNDLLEVFNSDPFFYNLEKKLNGSREGKTCAVPCDFRIDTLFITSDNFEADAVVSSDKEERILHIKYELVKEDGNWIRGSFSFFSKNDTIHTISFNTGDISNQNETSNFVSTINGINNYMFLEDLLNIDSVYQELDILRKCNKDAENLDAEHDGKSRKIKYSKSCGEYYFYDDISSTYFLLDDICNHDTQDCRLFINGFIITNNIDSPIIERLNIGLPTHEDCEKSDVNSVIKRGKDLYIQYKQRIDNSGQRIDNSDGN